MKPILTAAIALSLITGSVTTAYADGRDGDRYERRGDDRHGKDYGKRGKEHKRDKRSDDARDWRGRHAHSPSRHEYAGYHAGRYVRPPGHYHHEWRRGERLPRAWYSSRYVVHDYHSYRVRTPPRGYHWVRVDNDLILTAIATGLVIEIVGGMFR